MLRAWKDLPPVMQTEAVKPYYESLQNKKISLVCKFIFDKVTALVLLVILSPVFLLIGLAIKLDSPGEIFFRQERVTQYGKKFRIYKFRTMVQNAEAVGAKVTTDQDKRITVMGKQLRDKRLDELPQLINILQGDMSFVGTRPEVTKYVEKYTPEMLATLLLPAGVTSEASIEYKDEAKLLAEAQDAGQEYLEQVLPAKMVWNLESLKKFSFTNDVKTIIKTVEAVV